MLQNLVKAKLYPIQITKTKPNEQYNNLTKFAQDYQESILLPINSNEQCKNSLEMKE